MSLARLLALVRVDLPAGPERLDHLGLSRHQARAVDRGNDPGDLLRVGQNLLDQHREQLLQLGVALGL
eukprot:7382286-Pyramimonas_sp.AAC.1